MSPPLYKVMMLSGPMQGRVIKLFSGPFSIGKNGDLLANLIGIEAIHLDVSLESIRIMDQVPVWVEGVLTEDLEQLPLNQCIEIAGNGFVFAHIDDDIVQRDLPNRKLIKRSHSHQQASRKIYRYLFIALCVVSCVVSVIIVWPENQKPISSTSPVSSEQWINAQIKQLGEVSIVPKWHQNVLTLTGYCKNHLQKDRLVSMLNVRNIIYSDQVTCEDSLLESIRTLLKNQGFSSVLVSSGKELGTVNIQGNIPDNEKWSTIVETLGQIPGLKGWNVSHISGSGIKDLIRVLREKHLLSGLKISQLGNKLLVIGESPHSDAVKTVIKTLAKNKRMRIDYKEIPIIKNSELSAEVTTYVSHQNDPFVVLDNGKILSKGSITSMGYKVIFIDRQGMDLSKQSDTVHIPFLF